MCPSAQLIPKHSRQQRTLSNRSKPLSWACRTPQVKRMHETPAKPLLIVEDEAVIRFVLRCELEQRGFSVTEVEDGRNAIEQFTQDPDRWIGAFIDFLLPDARGDELIERFLELRPDLSVVLM